MGLTLVAEAIRIVKGDRTILSDASARLAPGRLTVMVGPNGAGKSTLMRAFAGLETLTGGRVQIEGHGDVLTMDPIARARLIAWVPAATDQAFGFTALETAVLGRFPWHLGTPSAKDQERAEEALELMGIAALAHRPVAELSSGEQRKVAIARALAGDSKILLLDEPCANLDIGAALSLLATLRRLAHAGRTICLTLHDLPLAHRFADDGICLAQGLVASAGTATSSLTPELLGNVFDVTADVARTQGGEATLFVR